jgi:hypothetical protein
MTKRKRNEPDSTLSLFAFQDIITGTTGIIIFVLIILSLDFQIPDQTSENPVALEAKQAAIRLKIVRAKKKRVAKRAELEELQDELAKVDTSLTLEALKRITQKINQ